MVELMCTALPFLLFISVPIGSFVGKDQGLRGVTCIANIRALFKKSSVVICCFIVMTLYGQKVWLNSSNHREILGYRLMANVQIVLDKIWWKVKNHEMVSNSKDQQVVGKSRV